MLDSAKNVAQVTLLCVLSACPMKADDLPGNWTGNYARCDGHAELLKQDHMKVGVRISTSDSNLAVAFVRAINFWATVIDMEWHEESGPNCSIQLVEGERELFKPGEVARAQFPGRPAFQGWIAFKQTTALSADEQFLVAVHELGHVLGLQHNPSARSVMYFLGLDASVLLDESDLTSLAARHKLRDSRLGQRLVYIGGVQSLAGADARRPFAFGSDRAMDASEKSRVRSIVLKSTPPKVRTEPAIHITINGSFAQRNDIGDPARGGTVAGDGPVVRHPALAGESLDQLSSLRPSRPREPVNEMEK
jgi:matrixin